ncbi:MAG TPA: hypothetical protein VJ836_07120 [Candidatus Saccharimonadales bacterium]|nr:hypothetical protein [Candidatus Saccharimonadales bacterium]
MDGGDRQSVQHTDDHHWQFKPEGSVPLPDVTAEQGEAPQGYVDEADSVSWTASEFVEHEKGTGWFALLTLVMLVGVALLYLITRDVISTVAVAILGIVIGVAAGRKPRVIPYKLDRSGLTINTRFHPYGNFKSFAIIDEGAFSSIMFLPLKRFMPAISVYFAPEDQDKIVAVVSQHLPLQQGGLDLIDKFMHRIHF